MKSYVGTAYFDTLIGQQALEVLGAGASVAQVYTALVYGGVNTIHRMKTEMRNEMKRLTQQNKS